MNGIQPQPIHILTGKRFELDVLDYIPEIKNSPQAIEVIAELMAKVMSLMPDMKIEGDISEDLEATACGGDRPFYL